jgi:CheY-like chemotaxis protein
MSKELEAEKSGNDKTVGKNAADGGLMGAHSPRVMPERIKILIVELVPDEPSAAEVMLEGRGHRVATASGRDEALSLLQGGGFDVLLIDLDLPNLDGYELARAARNNVRTDGGPLLVAAMTDDWDKHPREACLAAGIEGYLRQPFLAAAMLDEIERLYKKAPSE